MRRSFQLLKFPVHSVASNGFSNSNVELYHNIRPTYKTDVIDKIDQIIYSSSSSLSSNSIKLLEIGSGTGKFTQAFLEHEELKKNEKFSYIATEPSDSFRLKLQSQIKDWNFKLANVIVEEGTGEVIPIKDNNSISGIIIAQAFHWMSNINTLKEINRVLLPKSPLILVWNSMNRKIDWINEIELQTLDPYYITEGNSIIPRQITNEWKKAFEDSEGNKLFNKLSYWKTSHIHMCSADDIVNRILSVSVVVILDDKEKEIIKSKIYNILLNHPDTRELKEYPLCYETDIVWSLSN
jgi:ubiquinone/menaquinone biosynthesis C-methylase UbiE